MNLREYIHPEDISPTPEPSTPAQRRALYRLGFCHSFVRKHIGSKESASLAIDAGLRLHARLRTQRESSCR